MKRAKQISRRSLMRLALMSLGFTFLGCKQRARSDGEIEILPSRSAETLSSTNISELEPPASQTPLPTATPTDSPTLPSPPIARILAVAGGYSHTLVLGEDGAVWAWGSNDKGELGFASPSVRVRTPNWVPGILDIRLISAGAGFSAAIDHNNTLWMWGINDLGQLARQVEANYRSPTQVLSELKFEFVDLGHSHVVAILEDKTALSWGYDALAEMTDANQIIREPAQLENLSGIKAVAAGESHNLALTIDGYVFSWGYNEFGVLGNGTEEDRTNPAPVPELEDIIAISAGTGHSLALKSDGTVWAWGSYYSDSPIQVEELSNIVAIASGWYHSLALTNDGHVWTWGLSSEGELGRGIEDREFRRPAQVPGLERVSHIAGGGHHSLAYDEDGKLWAWGWNGWGQLGTGDTQDREVPVQVPLNSG